MARLIPEFMDDSIPPGERDVFNMLAAGPDDWVVLHSLDLAPWNHDLRTEIDFVILVPDIGILCLEVKSQRSITFDGSRWHPKTIKRSPLKQAADGRYTFYRRLSGLTSQFKHVPVMHCCIFTKSEFVVRPNLSINPWELMDAREFCSFKSAEQLCASLKTRMTKCIQADRSVRKLNRPLSARDMETIIEYCVPIQKHQPDARQEIVRRQIEVDKLLREQQKPVLKLAASNNRTIIRGPAGTGKTLIAMEIARRAAEDGKRVALLCFNQLVGDWMQQLMGQVRPQLPNLVVGRAIRVMASMAEIEIPGSPPPEFWDVTLPGELEERLTDPEFEAIAQFDYMVLDEAQDILSRPWLWECLTLLIHGGVEKGSYAMFGDFEHQILTDRTTISRSLAILDSVGQPSYWDLDENCRNYPIVGNTAVQLAGIGSVYSEYLRSGGSVHNYDIFFYSNEADQLNRLREWLDEFIAYGYKPSEITVLSFRADHLSVAARLREEGYSIKPIWQSTDSISYSSVHAFKGMENKIVILCDVKLDHEAFRRDLFYTGMTRSTETVRVLCDSASQSTLMKWISEG